MLKKILTSCLLLSGLILLIAAPLSKAIAAPLPSDDAFKLQGFTKDTQTIVAKFTIAPHYYIYQSSLKIIAEKPQDVVLGTPLVPYNTQLLNTPLGEFHVYSDSLSIGIPVISHINSAISVLVHFQGCSHDGYCYPPITKILQLDLAGPYNQVFNSLNPNIEQKTQLTKNSESKTSIFEKHHLIVTLLIFLGLGILIACTPCVLPMVPILSSIIIGKNAQKSHRTAFLLSLSYVFGIAITYAVIGVIFGLMGSNIQTALQKPWIICVFVAIFIAMALSLFGLYTIQLPQAIRQHVQKINNQQSKQHSYFGSFFMGILSTLIVSPCVTAPLVGALTYISNQGSMLIGGAALFFLGIGIGIPLLIIATLGHKYIPKSGAWMNTVQGILGVLLLGVAIFMLGRILPAHIVLILWGILAIGSGIACFTLIKPLKKMGLFFIRTMTMLLCLYGILLIIGGSLGNTNPWQPLQSTMDEKTAPFISVYSRKELAEQLAIASQKKQPVLIDFYANWCIACKIMEKNIFSDGQIINKLKKYRLLKIDVTDQSIEEKALQHQFGVIAPPTIIFYNAQGDEEENKRIVGEVSKDSFLEQLN